jgi:transcriptional regulator with XRE-family HTH domain
MKREIIQKMIDTIGNQELLARKCGVSQATISNLLNYKTKDIRLPLAKKMSKVTGISIDKIINDMDKKIGMW